MIASDLIKKLKKFQGPVYVEISNFNDTIHVQAVKKDLIYLIETRFTSDSETGFEMDDFGFMSKDYDNN